MRRVYQVTGVLFLLLSAFVVQEGHRLKYYTEIGPGPGFFPFWLGSLMAVLSVVWLFRLSLRPVERGEASFLPDRAGVVRVVAILVALALFTVLVDVVGFRLTMFCFLLIMLTVLGRQRPVMTIAVSVLGSFGVYYVFRQLLNVHLPSSSIDFLENLGL